MGHSSWAILETERYRLIRRAERILKSYLGYWDFICKDRLRNYNLLLKAGFNTAYNLHIFYRIEFGGWRGLGERSINLDNKTELRW